MPSSIYKKYDPKKVYNFTTALETLSNLNKSDFNPIPKKTFYNDKNFSVSFISGLGAINTAISGGVAIKGYYLISATIFITIILLMISIYFFLKHYIKNQEIIQKSKAYISMGQLNKKIRIEKYFIKIINNNIRLTHLHEKALNGELEPLQYYSFLKEVLSEYLYRKEQENNKKEKPYEEVIVAKKKKHISGIQYLHVPEKAKKAVSRKKQQRLNVYGAGVLVVTELQKKAIEFEKKNGFKPSLMFLRDESIIGNKVEA